MGMRFKQAAHAGLMHLLHCPHGVTAHGECVPATCTYAAPCAHSAAVLASWVILCWLKKMMHGVLVEQQLPMPKPHCHRAPHPCARRGATPRSCCVCIFDMSARHRHSSAKLCHAVRRHSSPCTVVCKAPQLLHSASHVRQCRACVQIPSRSTPLPSHPPC